jgi:RHS repeat-associated protein
MRRVLTALLVLVGVLPATLHAAPASTHASIDTTTHFARSYFGARYYASQTGRFTTVDPFFDLQANLVEPQRWNRYAYVSNNPLRYVDPLGLYQFEAACGNGDSACFESQQRFRDALAAVRTAANNLEIGSKERNRLERALKRIGETEGSGATIAFGDAGQDVLGRANWFANKITLNVGLIDSVSRTARADTGALFAATVAHEGTHLSGAFPGLGRVGIGNYAYVSEGRPLFAESSVYQGLGVNDSLGLLWNNSWSTLDRASRERLRTLAVEDYRRRTR